MENFLSSIFNINGDSLPLLSTIPMVPYGFAFTLDWAYIEILTLLHHHSQPTGLLYQPLVVTSKVYMHLLLCTVTLHTCYVTSVFTGPI